jgi:hypothetical protein
MALDRLDYVALAAFIAVVLVLCVLLRDGADGDGADMPDSKTTPASGMNMRI